MFALKRSMRTCKEKKEKFVWICLNTKHEDTNFNDFQRNKESAHAMKKFPIILINYFDRLKSPCDLPRLSVKKPLLRNTHQNRDRAHQETENSMESYKLIDDDCVLMGMWGSF